MRGINLLRRLASAFRGTEYQPSYSQCGEDRILRFLFDLVGKAHPTYLDVGAHHPSHMSNSYYFYENGSHGICVEPDPSLFDRIRDKRPRDICLNVGVATDRADDLDFFVFDNPTYNTFSATIKDEQIQAGRSLIHTLKVNVISINEIIEKHLPAGPDFVSLDTEGFDLAIMQTFNFQKYRPTAFCIETLTNIGENKMPEIAAFMKTQQYEIFADSYVNTIFVDRIVWSARKLA